MSKVRPHSSGPLAPLHGRGGPFSDYGISQEGVVYYSGAHSMEYGSDYFLSEYRSQYGRTYIEDEPMLRKLAAARIRRIRAHRQSAGRLLEIGCAAGFFLHEAERAGFQVTGLDVSEYAVNYARETFGVNARRESFLEAEFKEHSFDVVCAFYVIEHFPDQRGIFRKLSDLLAPGGLFVFALPSTNGPMFRFHRKEWVKTHPVDHFADYSPLSLRRVLPYYGLRPLEFRPASHHPERLPGYLLPLRFGPLYRFVANRIEFGDTMEGIAQKTE